MGDVYILNGKILSGLPNHAKDIEFDNTGTDLISTNSEDAIKEVNSKLSVKKMTLTNVNTGGTGMVNISDDVIEVIAAFTNNNSTYYMYVPYYANNKKTRLRVFNYAVGTMDVVLNTNISEITVYYRDIVEPS